MLPYHTIDLSTIEAHKDTVGTILITKPLVLIYSVASDSDAVIITMSIPLWA